MIDIQIYRRIDVAYLGLRLAWLSRCRKINVVHNTPHNTATAPNIELSSELLGTALY